MAKTYQNLFESIVSFTNLWQAAQKAQKGKRYKKNVLAFNQAIEKNLFELQEALLTKTYRQGEYKHFEIFEPKKRLISAAPYRDRVVHHALCAVIEPLFEKTFIYDSYANRKGKGTHKAILRYQHYAQSYQYVLKCDIKQFFPSIDHEVLKKLIRKKIACADTLWLIEHIIDRGSTTNQLAATGLPIGNLTSQFWANVYMNPLDHYLKDDLGLPYLRYVDDFVVFGNDKAKLQAIKNQISNFLIPYGLTLHPIKTRVHQVKEGLLFLGHRVFPTFRLLNKDNVKRFRKRLRKRVRDLEKGKITEEYFQNSLQSWIAHAKFSNTYRLRKKIMESL